MKMLSKKRVIWFCSAMLFLCGCQQEAKTERPPSDVPLKMENQRLQSENAALKERLETIMGIDKAVRLEAVAGVAAIEIAGRSSLADQDKDGKKEALIVYLRTIDDMGDVVKAPGEVKIELWMLQADEQQPLIGEWIVMPADLKKNWSGSLLTNYYKLSFSPLNLPQKQPKEFTIKAVFTDYMSGKVLTAQRVIKSGS